MPLKPGTKCVPQKLFDYLTSCSPFSVDRTAFISKSLRAAQSSTCGILKILHCDPTASTNETFSVRSVLAAYWSHFWPLYHLATGVD